MIDFEHLPAAQAEQHIPHVLYRLYLPLSSLNSLLDGPIIHHGTTIVFKGYENPFARYVIEWSEGEDHQYAYLRVVGTTDGGIPIPYDNPSYPTFILAVPVRLSTVPFRPQSSIDNIADPFLEDAPLSSGVPSGTRMFKAIRKAVKTVRRFFKK